MMPSPEEIAEIEAVAALTTRLAAVIDLTDARLSLNALADLAACCIQSTTDPETCRDQFVSAVDDALDALAVMPPDRSGS
jgi:hypothetical protein